MMRRVLGTTAAVVALAAVAVPSMGTASPAGSGTVAKGKKPTVKVIDDYYSPQKMTIKQNAVVKFKWDGGNANSHNVTFVKGPKGVKKSKKPCAGGKVTKCNVSGTGSIGVNFEPKFDKKGEYEFHCTIHPTVMDIHIKVKGN